MERGFHPSFNIALGNSRLLYSVQENRAFHHAIFRKINFLGRRGTIMRVLVVLGVINYLKAATELRLSSASYFFASIHYMIQLARFCSWTFML
jgi:hypothetical protein